MQLYTQSNYRTIVLLLISALLSGCALLQAITGTDDAPTRPTTSVNCPIKDDASYDYMRAEQSYSRYVEKWRGKTIQRHEPGIDALFDQKRARIAFIYSQALRDNPCIEGAIDWVLVFRNDGTLAEIRQLWSSINYPPLEFELRKALSDIRLLPIAAPQNSVYLLPITFRADATHTPSLNTRSFMIQ